LNPTDKDVEQLGVGDDGDGSARGDGVLTKATYVAEEKRGERKEAENVRG
jgi:hypothetical protein